MPLDLRPNPRRSSFFRNRSSMVVVNEIKGVPFQWISFALSVFEFVFFVRDNFFCGQAMSNDPVEIEMMAPFSNCNDIPLMRAAFTLTGTWALCQGLIRGFAALATDTTGFAHAMALIAFNDLLLVAISAPLSTTEFPSFYSFFFYVAVIYQAYVAYTAYRAYKARNKTKDFKASEQALKETRTLPFQVVAIVLTLVQAPLSVRDMLYCGTPLFDFEKEGFVGFADDCADHTSKGPFFKHVAICYIFFITIRLFAAFGVKRIEEFEMVMVVVLIASLGELTAIFRAQVNPLALSAAFFMVGYDAHMLMESHQKAALDDEPVPLDDEQKEDLKIVQEMYGKAKAT